MVDLKKIKDSKLKGDKVTYSTKKREKRKAKKQKELEEEAKTQRKLLTTRKVEPEKVEVIQPKVMIKKAAPKKVIEDPQGSWEVVDQKKSVYVEAPENNGEDSLSD